MTTIFPSCKQIVVHPAEALNFELLELDLDDVGLAPILVEVHVFILEHYAHVRGVGSDLEVLMRVRLDLLVGHVNQKQGVVILAH